MQTIDINIQDPSFSCIKNGTKTIEARLYKGKFCYINTGDQLCINNDILVDVVRIERYKSFREMLEIEGFKNAIPYVDTIEEAESVYKQHYSEEERLMYHVALFHINETKSE